MAMLVYQGIIILTQSFRTMKETLELDIKFEGFPAWLSDYIKPICSMGRKYFPTWMVNFMGNAVGKYTIHGVYWYDIYTVSTLA